jgi:malonate transporter and related proteins
VSVVLDIVAPVFGLVLLGYGAARLGTFDEAATRGLSLFVFDFAIPIMLVRTMGRVALPAEPEWGLIVVYFGTTFAVFGMGALAARRLFARSGAEPAIFGITAAFSNSLILGIPLTLEAFGEAAAVPLFLIIAFHSALLFTLTTVVAEAGLGVGLPLSRLPLNVGKALVANPILWGLAVGLAMNLGGLALPGPVDRLARYLGDASLPCALFALGANLSRFRLGTTLRAALLLTAVKNLAHPALVLLAAPLLDLAPLTTKVALTIAACPSGVNAYLFAARYKASVEEASSTILVSTAVSVVTLSVLLGWLRG